MKTIGSGMLTEVEVTDEGIPLFMEWMDMIDTQGGIPAHKAAEFWSNMETLFSAMPAASIQELLEQRSDFIIVVMTEINAECFENDSSAWVNCCCVWLRCFAACENALWNDMTEYPAQNMALEILTTVEKPTTSVSELDAKAVGFHVMCVLLKESSFLWTDDAVLQLVSALKVNLAFCGEAGEFSDRFVAVLKQLIVQSAAHKRKNLLAANLLAAAQFMDVTQVFDEALSEMLCKLPFAELWLRVGPLMLRCHAGLCVSASPENATILRDSMQSMRGRHECVATFLIRLFDPSIGDELREPFFESLGAFWISGNACLDAASCAVAKKFLNIGISDRDLDVLGRFHVENGILRGVRTGAGASLPSHADVIATLCAGHSQSNALFAFLHGVSCVYRDLLAEPSMKAFLRCTKAASGASVSSAGSCSCCGGLVKRFSSAEEILSTLCSTVSAIPTLVTESSSLVELYSFIRKALGDFIFDNTEKLSDANCVRAVLSALLALEHRLPRMTPAPSAPTAIAARDISSAFNTAVSAPPTNWLQKIVNARKAAAASHGDSTTEPREKKSGDSSVRSKPRLGKPVVEDIDGLDEFKFEDLRTARGYTGPDRFDDYRQRGLAASDGARGIGRIANSESVSRGDSVNPDSSLDVYLDAPQDVASLDVGYVDYEEMAALKQREAKKAAARPVDLNKFLNLAASSTSGSSASRRHSSASRTPLVRQSSAESNEGIERTNLVEFMRKVAVEKFYLHVLKLPVSSFAAAESQESRFREDFKNLPNPNRFLNDDQYIEYFLPLLLAEVEASLRSEIEKTVLSERRYGAVISAAPVANSAPVNSLKPAPVSAPSIAPSASKDVPLPLSSSANVITPVKAAAISAITANEIKFGLSASINTSNVVIKKRKLGESAPSTESAPATKTIKICATEANSTAKETPQLRDGSMRPPAMNPNSDFRIFSMRCVLVRTRRASDRYSGAYSESIGYSYSSVVAADGMESLDEVQVVASKGRTVSRDDLLLIVKQDSPGLC